MNYLVLFFILLSSSVFSEQSEKKIYIIADLKSCDKFVSAPLYIFDYLEYGECQHTKLEILLKSNRAKDTVLFHRKYKTNYSVKHFSYDDFKDKKFNNNDNIIILNNQDSIVFNVNTGNVSNIDSLKIFLKNKFCE